MATRIRGRRPLPLHEPLDTGPHLFDFPHGFTHLRGIDPGQRLDLGLVAPPDPDQRLGDLADGSSRTRGFDTQLEKITGAALGTLAEGRELLLYQRSIALPAQLLEPGHLSLTDGLGVHLQHLELGRRLPRDSG